MKSWIPDSRNFAYLTWKQVDALPRDTTLLVLPTAAIEQHGPHLPLATDTLINSILLGAALERLPQEASVYALPAVCYGKSNEHIGFPGTLSVSAATFMAVLRDLGASIAAAGFKKVVLFNSHGGNSSLVDVMARDLRAEFGLRTFCLFGAAGAKFSGLTDQERAYGFHAGDMETSFLLSAIPDLVHTGEYTVNYIADIEKPELLRPENASATFAWLTRDIAPSGVMGDPNPATAEKGARWIEEGAEKVAAALTAMAAYNQLAQTVIEGMIDCGSGVRLERGVRCILSDGIVLVSDHYYPPAAGPNPTLLMRQPYGRDIASTVVYAHPVWFAAHGYNVVIQDVRGRGDSEGDFYPFRHEGVDGAETIRWLRTRSESNGKIGMYGFSYQGLTQLLAAAQQPEGLTCIAPAMTACDLYHGWFYRQGALRLASSLGWGLQMLKADARRRNLRAASDGLERAWTDLRSQPLGAPYGMHPQLQHEGLPTYVQDWITHNQPGPYWSDLDVSASLDRIQVPALHISGWFDTYLGGSVDGFRAMSQHSDQYLVAGPWIHIPWGEIIGDQNFGPEALFDTDALLLRWFNHWLKDSGEFAHEPRIRHFALGANRWFSAESFPSQSVSLYLHSQGRAESRKGDGVLSAAIPTAAEPRDVFVYDPEVPVNGPTGPSNQAPLELGNNLLVYTGAALAEPLHIFGSAKLTLYAITSAAYADFTVKLVRLRPMGQAEFICIGIARSSYLFRGYQADAVHCWEIELEPTSCLFAAGDAIRIEIASCAFPLYDRNPSAPVEPWLADVWTWKRSTQMVLHDAEHPSRIDLPLAATA